MGKCRSHFKTQLRNPRGKATAPKLRRACRGKCYRFRHLTCRDLSLLCALGSALTSLAMRIEVVHVVVFPLILTTLVAVKHQAAVASTADNCESKLVQSTAANERKVLELMNMGKELERLRRELRDISDKFEALKSTSTQKITTVGMDLPYEKSYVRTRCARACVVGLVLLVILDYGGEHWCAER